MYDRNHPKEEYTAKVCINDKLIELDFYELRECIENELFIDCQISGIQSDLSTLNYALKSLCGETVSTFKHFAYILLQAIGLVEDSCLDDLINYCEGIVKGYSLNKINRNEFNRRYDEWIDLCCPLEDRGYCYNY